MGRRLTTETKSIGKGQSEAETLGRSLTTESKAIGNMKRCSRGEADEVAEKVQQRRCSRGGAAEEVQQRR